MNRTHETQDLLQLADACVVCGLCVPHCPTYRKTGLEADAPRGRIQLMRAVLREELPASPRFHEHIDGCLTCRSCEAVCPNHVRYGELVDGIRARYPASTHRRRWFDGPLAWLVGHPRLWAWAAVPVSILQRLGLEPAFRRFGLPRLPLPGPARSAKAAQPTRGRVSLFLGCVARLADAPALTAARRLLAQAGYQVDIASGQGCCGALALHQGNRELARQQAENNRRALGSGPVVFCASGCGATLLEYAALGIDDLVAEDILALLDRLPADTLRFRSLPQTVWLQTPCTQRNVVRSISATERLLRRIPQLDVRHLPGNDQCCGAAGRYHLDQPEMANSLRGDKIQAIRDSGADTVLSSNVGCALWLRAALPDVRLIHPLELLAQQLET